MSIAAGTTEQLAAYRTGTQRQRIDQPGGKLWFAEHGRSPDLKVRLWQDRITPLWKPLAGGCHLNRDIPAQLVAGGFTIGQLETSYLKGPRPMTWVYRGWAE